MSEVIDATGLSCPKPVMLMVKKLKSIENGEFSIIVDNDTAKENVCRTAEERNGKIISIEREQGNYVINIGTK
ncbi:sulfurtransferase TusA family protein [Candidatus Margulisiibacteriota bacterium]